MHFRYVGFNHEQAVLTCACDLGSCCFHAHIGAVGLLKDESLIFTAMLRLRVFRLSGELSEVSLPSSASVADVLSALPKAT